jgi:hypothetical protein
MYILYNYLFFCENIYKNTKKKKEKERERESRHAQSVAKIFLHVDECDGNC